MGVRVAGSGGQGVITIGRVLGRAAVLHDRLNAVLTEDYGPEKTGGWSRADLLVDSQEIGYPIVEQPDVFIALSQDGYERYEDTPKPEAWVFLEHDLVRSSHRGERAARRIPAVQAARDLGNRLAANMVMMGAVVELTRVVSVDAARRSLTESTPPARRELNEAAFERGRAIARGTPTGGRP